MALAAFIVISIFGVGFLTEFFFALYKDGKRHRQCGSVERLLRPDYELDLDRPNSHSTRPPVISIDHHRVSRDAPQGFGTGASGAAD
jgi:hypothetical protein